VNNKKDVPMKRETPSAIQDRILSLVAGCPASNGMRTSELESAAGMTAGEVRMATKWLAANGYLKGTRRVVRFNFGHQGFARKPLLFWTLTDKGRRRTAEAAPPAALAAPDSRSI
jgi:hypothetical protein